MQVKNYFHQSQTPVWWRPVEPHSTPSVGIEWGVGSGRPICLAGRRSSLDTARPIDSGPSIVATCGAMMGSWDLAPS